MIIKDKSSSTATKLLSDYTGVRIDINTHKKLQALSEKEGRSMGAEIRFLTNLRERMLQAEDNMRYTLTPMVPIEKEIVI